jgi:hypothetical protein
MIRHQDFDLPQDVQLTHPHDFLRLKHPSIIPGTCFVIMPFGADFDKVFEVIKEALAGLFECSRADMQHALGEPVLDGILGGISTAEFIVADLTDNNPNVFYELGIAHATTKNVLLLTRDIQTVPFDLRNLFCAEYHPRYPADLKDKVKRAAEAVLAKRLPSILEDQLTRTCQIVGRLEALCHQPEKLSKTIIRHQAGLSSFSNVPFPDAQDPTRREYGEWLERERLALVQCLEEGATTHLILAPFITPWRDPDRLRERWDRLLEFLHREGKFMERLRVAIAPVPGPNLLFIGEEVLFEGHKRSLEGGFGFTMVYTDRTVVRKRVEAFDSLLQSAEEFTLRGYVPEGRQIHDPRILREAVIAAVRRGRDHEGSAEASLWEFLWGSRKGTPTGRKPLRRRGLRGAWRGSPAATEDLENAREEMWTRFPREV